MKVGINDRRLKRALETIARVEKKMPHHTKNDKRHYRNAKNIIQIHFAVIFIEAEVTRIKLLEHQELKGIMRQP